MKIIIVTLIGVFFLVIQGNAQNDSPVNRSCSVVCLDDSWIPSSYNVGAKCAIKYASEGVISVHETNDVSDKKNFNREDFITFKVAIFRKKDGTIISYSDESYTSLGVQKVLARCQKGDEIIIILNDSDKYSLPHHRIEVI